MEIKRTIETLLKPPSLKGKLIEDEKESVTIQISDSLFEIPKEYIINMSEFDESKNVEIELSKDAILVQKTLVIAKKDVLETVTADIFERTFERSDYECSRCTTECSYCICGECECSYCTLCSLYKMTQKRRAFTRSRFRVPISRSR